MSAPSRRLQRRNVSLALLLGVSAAGACSSTPPPEPHAGVAERWGQFLSMPRQRAFALAGDPDAAWVGATVGGYPSPIEAERAALRECEQRRAARRITAPCRLYASGHRIVWDGAEATK
jgi:hypothetical protein